MSLPVKIVALHNALATAKLPHAFGGALALAWCTGRARGTIDIDVNVFVHASDAARAVAALPPAVARDAEQLRVLTRDGQVRLWWDHTPVDVFLNTTNFHEQVATRVRWERFMDQSLPFLCCDDLAVFKAFFNRNKDWVDLEEMMSAGTLDVARVIGLIVQYVGDDHPRIEKLRTLGTPAP